MFQILIRNFGRTKSTRRRLLCATQSYRFVTQSFGDTIVLWRHLPRREKIKSISHENWTFSRIEASGVKTYFVLQRLREIRKIMGRTNEKGRKRSRHKSVDETSVTRLGNFWKFLATNLLTKGRPKTMLTFWAVLKRITFCKNCCGIHLSKCCKHLGYIFTLVTLDRTDIAETHRNHQQQQTHRTMRTHTIT